MRVEIINKQKPDDIPITYVRQVRTFGAEVSKKDLKKFPELTELNGEDFTYIVYEAIEIDYPEYDYEEDEYYIDDRLPCGCCACCGCSCHDDDEYE